jgi:hypothetical protein
VVEHAHQTATVAEWHRKHQRHEIYTNGKRVELDQPSHSTLTPLVHIEAELPAHQTRD